MPGICRKPLMRRWGNEMKKYVFPTGGSYGSGDSWEGEFAFELSDQDAERLEASAREKPRGWLDEDPEIADIEEKVRRAAYMANVKELVKDKEFVREQRAEYEKATGAKGADDLAIIRWYMEGKSFGIMYPVKLYELDEEPEEEN